MVNITITINTEPQEQIIYKLQKAYNNIIKAINKELIKHYETNYCKKPYSTIKESTKNNKNNTIKDKNQYNKTT